MFNNLFPSYAWNTCKACLYYINMGFTKVNKIAVYSEYIDK